MNEARWVPIPALWSRNPSSKKKRLVYPGTRGRRGLHRLALGSVAEELLRRAGCPVLTVGPPHAGGKRAAS
jgi:nucleotide-binding universal stress UspA family protein